MVIGVFMVPLYLRYIPVGTYGVWLATGNVLMWVSLVDPGLAYVLQQRAASAYGKRDLAQVGRVFGTGVVMNVALVALFLGIAAGLAENLPRLVVVPHAEVWNELRDAFGLAAIGGALNLVSFVFRCGNQALHAAIPVGAIDISVRTTGVIVVWLALINGWGLRSFGVMAIWTGVLNAVGNALCLSLLTRRIGIRWGLSLETARELLGLMSFNFLGRIANAAQGIDLLVINKLLGPETTAAFGLTRRVPDFLRPILFVPVESAGPSLAHAVGEGRPETIRNSANRLCWLSLWLTGLATAGCFALNEAFVGLWVGAELFSGRVVNSLITLQMAVFMLISAFSSLAFYLGDVAHLNVFAFARAVVLIVSLVVGGKIWGIEGVAGGGLAAMVVFAWYPIWSTVRRANLPSADRRALWVEGLKIFGAVVFSASVARLVPVDTWIDFFLVALCLTALYITILALWSPLFRGVLSISIDYMRKQISLFHARI